MYYFPEPVSKPHDLAIELIEHGHNVTAITSLPNYPSGDVYSGYPHRSKQWEAIDGVHILRVPHIIDRSHSAPRRILSYLSFSFAATWAALRLSQKSDIIWTYQIGLPGVIVSILRHIPLVHEVQDLWPEWGQSSMGLKSWTFKILDIQERLIYKIAHSITTISDGFCRALVSKGVPQDKITVIPNWANENNFQPVPPDTELSKREGLDGHFNVIYGGNIGTAQALDVLIDTAVLLLDCPEIQLIIIGDGVERYRLQCLSENRGLSNLHFLGSRAPEQMASYYAMADVLLLHLKDDPHIAITIPSKTYAYLASQKPILAAARGDVASLIQETHSGLVCPPQDPFALAQTIRKFRLMSQDKRQQMGLAGRQAFLTRFTRKVLVQRYQSLFESVLSSS
jgi:glycosyltransferase involved in cell wall biosynthesis